jgi:hypothetical protein
MGTQPGQLVCKTLSQKKKKTKKQKTLSLKGLVEQLKM